MRKIRSIMAVALSVVMSMSGIQASAETVHIDWDENINILNEENLTVGEAPKSVTLDAGCTVSFIGNVEIVDLASEDTERNDGKTACKEEGDKALKIQRDTDTESESYDSTYDTNILFEFPEDKDYNGIVEITFSLWFHTQTNGLNIGYFNDVNGSLLSFHRSAKYPLIYNASKKDADGNPAPGTEQLPNRTAKKWYNYKLLLDVAENTFQIEQDGVKITTAFSPDGKFPFKSDTNPGLNGEFKSFRISVPPAASTATHMHTTYVDNLTVRGCVEKPEILSKTENVAATREISLELDRAVCDGDITKETLSLTSEEAVAPAIESLYKVSDKEWKIFLEDRIDYGKTYILDLPTIRDSVGKTADLEYEFTTEQRKPLGIYKLGLVRNNLPIYTLTPGEVTALLTIDNNTGEPIDVVAAIIIYKKVSEGFVMTDVKAASKSGIETDSEYSFENLTALTVTVPDDGEEYFIKVYAWDNLSNMMPFAAGAYTE